MARVATAKCDELSQLLWFIKTGWKLPSTGNKLIQMEIYQKYHSEQHNLQVIDGCIYKINNDDEVLGG